MRTGCVSTQHTPLHPCIHASTIQHVHACILAATTDVVITNIVEPLLVVPLDWFAFTVDDCFGCNNAALTRICLDDLEFDSPHRSTDQEQIALAHGAICLQEVGFEEDIEQVTLNTLTGKKSRYTLT